MTINKSLHFSSKNVVKKRNNEVFIRVSFYFKKYYFSLQYVDSFLVFLI